MGWSQPQRGRVGLGTQGCGLALPGTVHSRLGPSAPSQLSVVPMGRLMHTDPVADRGTEDPFVFVGRHGIGGALGRGPRKWLPGCGGEVSQLLPSDLEAARESSGQSQDVWQEDMPKSLHGWVEQKQPLERRFFPFAKITPSGPKWEVSRAGRLGEPHPR